MLVWTLTHLVVQLFLSLRRKNAPEAAQLD